MSYRVNEVNVLIDAAGRQLTLDNGYQRAVLSARGRGMAAPQYFIDDGLSYDGQRISGYRFGARNIELVITDIETTRSRYYDLRDRIIDFIRPNRGDLTLRHIRKDAVRDIQVYPTNGIFDEEHTRGSRGFIAPLQFLAPNPFFYDPVEKTGLIDDVSTGGFGFPFGFPFGFLPAAFLSKTFTYNGNVKSYPRIEVLGPFSILVISHITRNINLYINQALGASRRLIINLDPRNITMQDDLGNNYLNASGDSDLINFYLEPGTNEISVSGSGHTTDTAVSLYYYERYLSL